MICVEILTSTMLLVIYESTKWHSVMQIAKIEYRKIGLVSCMHSKAINHVGMSWKYKDMHTHPHGGGICISQWAVLELFRVIKDRFQSISLMLSVYLNCSWIMTAAFILSFSIPTDSFVAFSFSPATVLNWKLKSFQFIDLYYSYLSCLVLWFVQ